MTDLDTFINVHDPYVNRHEYSLSNEHKSE